MKKNKELEIELLNFENYKLSKIEELIQDEDFDRVEKIKQLSEREKYKLIDETDCIEVLEILVFDNNWQIANSCFFNKLAKEFSPELLEIIFSKKGMSDRLAEHQNTPTKILKSILEKTKSYTERAVIASNRNCSIDMIKKFSIDEEATVRYWTTRNKKITTEILYEMLEKETEEFVIKSIISHKDF